MAVTMKDIGRKNKIIRVDKSVCYSNHQPFIKPPQIWAGTMNILSSEARAEPAALP